MGAKLIAHAVRLKRRWWTIHRMPARYPALLLVAGLAGGAWADETNSTPAADKAAPPADSALHFSVTPPFAGQAASTADTGGHSTVTPPIAEKPRPPAAAAIHFVINRFEITGNTLLADELVNGIFAKHTGTNVTFEDVAEAEKELQLQYHNRGFDTVKVTVPQQRLTNGVFKIRVFEGLLTQIVVMGNSYFSSNNVMRALPGLTTNVYLNSKYLQPELDMANASRDRQIYPEIHPGPTSNTTMLILRVKDRFPLHAKVEANNNNTPGTPDMRLSVSAEYDNLWEHENSIGAQYTFSEQVYKQGGGWPLYDRPLIANYSGFYRLPLGGPKSLEDAAAEAPGHFGYDEASRKFLLPSPTGATELNVYASGSTIDTGVTDGALKNLFSGTNGVIDQQTVHQDLTYNSALGFRITQPLPEYYGFRSHFQVGADYKQYKEVSYETNAFIFTQHLVDTSGNPFTRVSTTLSPVPASVQRLTYLPITVHYDVSRTDEGGITSMSVNYSPNMWYSGTKSNLDVVASSEHSSGYWSIVTGSLSREENLPADWKLALRGDGQWTSQPVIANEQFGAGGVSGVRGYHEGEVYGDTGWRITSELKLPPYRIGYAGDGTSWPLIVRSSIFMDYADTFLIDNQGRRADTRLWGTGVAATAALGSQFNWMMAFGWPLDATLNSEAYHVRINFALNAQF